MKSKTLQQNVQKIKVLEKKIFPFDRQGGINLPSKEQKCVCREAKTSFFRRYLADLVQRILSVSI